jgi:hypothetical protein
LYHFSTNARHGNAIDWSGRLDKAARDLLAPVLFAEPGDLSPRQARLRRWLELYDTGDDIARAMGDALSNEEALPADPDDAPLWAAVVIVGRMTPEELAKFRTEFAAAVG